MGCVKQWASSVKQACNAGTNLKDTLQCMRESFKSGYYIYGANR